LTFPGTGRVWESHPFTIADWGMMEPSMSFETRALHSSNTEDNSIAEKKIQAVSSKSNPEVQEKALTTPSSQGQERKSFYIRFLFRAQKGSTRYIFDKVTGSSPWFHGPLWQNLRVLTEGPYAGHSQTLYPLGHTDTVVCIVGGIGITFALGFLKEYLNSRARKTGEETELHNHGLMPKTTRFVLAWSVREEGLIRHITDNLIPGFEGYSARADGLEINIWHTGDRSQTSFDPKAQSHIHESSSSSSSSSPPPLPPPGPSGRLPSQANVPLAQHIHLTRNTRMPIDSVLSSTLERGRRTAILTCAPGGMADDVRAEVVNAVGRGFNADLVEEAFAW
jgi:hypothetical protein